MDFFNPSTNIFHTEKHSIFKRILVDLNKKIFLHSLALFTLPPPPPPPPRGGLKFLLVVEETTTAGWTTPANEEEEEKDTDDDPVSSPFAKMVKRAAEEAKTLVCGGEVELR